MIFVSKDYNKDKYNEAMKIYINSLFRGTNSSQEKAELCNQPDCTCDAQIDKKD